MFDFMNDGFAKTSFEQEEKVCKRCGMTLNEFLCSGVVGCSDCYKIFEEDVKRMIYSNHGAVNHTGKISLKHFSKLKIKEKIQELEKEKESAAQNEDYILAEALKGQIEKLKGELGNERL